MSPRAFFEDVHDALIGFLPPPLRTFSARRSGRNLKVWFGDEHREHYEVQLISSHALKAGELDPSVPVLEIGFHAEHPDGGRNDAALAHLVRQEKTWRRKLGTAAEAGAFLGQPAGAWRRISETWTGDDAVAADAAIDAAERLALYIETLEPLRRVTPEG